jgi:hypothetical protein
MTGVPDISFTEFDSEWTLEALPKKPSFGPVDDELEGAPRGKETTRAGRTVRRIVHELNFLNPRREFRYSRDQMGYNAFVSSGIYRSKQQLVLV